MQALFCLFQLKVDSNDAIVYEGLIYRKSVMDFGGRRSRFKLFFVAGVFILLQLIIK